MSGKDYIGILVSIFGTGIILLVSSSTNEPSLSPNDIIAAISQPVFLFYFICTMIALFALYRFSNSITAKKYLLVDLLLASIVG
jgi:hypothetical protein